MGMDKGGDKQGQGQARAGTSKGGDKQGQGQARAGTSKGKGKRESTGMKQDKRFREDDRGAASLQVVTQSEITRKKRGNEAAIAFCILRKSS